MLLAILSDIHANLTALQTVLDEIKKYNIDGFVLLGDIINYGMRPNETIQMLQSFDSKVVGNIWGNHEKAIVDSDTSRFSTERGKTMLSYTRKSLDEKSLDYIHHKMNNTGKDSLEIDGKRFLLVHGTIADPYWGKFSVKDFENAVYANYDYVLSGHSHSCHYYESFFPTDNPKTRNKKKTIFINPGSIGQPRNINPCAQCGVLDTKTSQYTHFSIHYPIEDEQKLYIEEIDSFYMHRLTLGI